MTRSVRPWWLIRLLVIVLLVAGTAACSGTRADGTTTPSSNTATAGSAPASTAPAAETSSQRSITVSGVGIVTVVPDIANVAIGASVTDSSVATALTDVDQRVTAVVQVIRNAGVGSDKIQTTQFSVTVNHDYSSPAQPVTGYTVTHLVRFSVAPDKVGKIISDSVTAGANQINGIDFTSADPSGAKEQARDLAVKDALTRAQQFAQSAGVTLGSPLSISEANAPTPVKSATAGSGMGSGAVTIEAGSQQIEMDVLITYEIK